MLVRLNGGASFPTDDATLLALLKQIYSSESSHKEYKMPPCMTGEKIKRGTRFITRPRFYFKGKFDGMQFQVCAVRSALLFLQLARIHLRPFCYPTAHARTGQYPAHAALSHSSTLCRPLSLPRVAVYANGYQRLVGGGAQDGAHPAAAGRQPRAVAARASGGRGRRSRAAGGGWAAAAACAGGGGGGGGWWWWPWWWWWWWWCSCC